MKSLYPILEQAVLSVKLLKAALKTYLRRQQRGPQFPNWSWLHESLVELIFGTVYAYEHIDAQELRTLFNRVGVVPVLSTVKIKPVRLGSVPGEVLLPTKPTEHRVVLFFMAAAMWPVPHAATAC
ncbi:MAG: hypothetical protein R2932_47370 [Caldilineaceae bacterium]